MKYFYLICYDNQIIEIQYTDERFKHYMQSKMDGKTIHVKGRPLVIEAGSISKIIGEEEYQNYIDTARPKMYIKDGTWYDIKEHRPVRHESWKKKKIQAMAIEKAKTNEDKPLTKAQKDRIEQIKKEAREMFTA